MSQNAYAEKLNAAQKQDDADHGREARHRVAPNQRLNEKVQQQQNGHPAEDHAGNGRDRQRRGRKGGDAVDGIQEQLLKKIMK